MRLLVHRVVDVSQNVSGPDEHDFANVAGQPNPLLAVAPMLQVLRPVRDKTSKCGTSHFFARVTSMLLCTESLKGMLQNEILLASVARRRQLRNAKRWA